MNDPALPVHDAMIAKLRADAGVTAIVGQRTYDAIPADAVRPYIQIPEPQVLPDPDRGTCVDGAESIFTVHGWADGPKSVQIRQLSDAIVTALDREDVSDLVVAGHRVLYCSIERIDYVPDPDRNIKHVALAFRVQTEPN